ncbi:MAG: Hsp20 family protein [Hyphomicrobiaceae bacterium]
MRHHDFNSLYRSTVGFDRLFQLLDAVPRSEGDAPTYPPYNIERRGEQEYRISMAVAGFTRDELTVDVKESTLSVRGEKQAEDKKTEYLHRGIAQRGFERRFQLADHVEVTGADLVNGLLHIDLVQSIPESMKTRTIEIRGSADKTLLEGKAA